MDDLEYDGLCTHSPFSEHINGDFGLDERSDVVRPPPKRVRSEANLVAHREQVRGLMQKAREADPEKSRATDAKCRAKAKASKKWSCDVCNIAFGIEKAFISHNNSIRHLKLVEERAAGIVRRWFCDICQIGFTQQRTLADHKTSKRHVKAAEAEEEDCSDMSGLLSGPDHVATLQVSSISMTATSPLAASSTVVSSKSTTTAPFPAATTSSIATNFKVSDETLSRPLPPSEQVLALRPVSTSALNTKAGLPTSQLMSTRTSRSSKRKLSPEGIEIPDSDDEEITKSTQTRSAVPVLRSLSTNIIRTKQRSKVLLSTSTIEIPDSEDELE